MAGTRSDPRYARARKAFLAEAKALGLPCARCGTPIDYDLVWQHGTPQGGYPTVNHRVPIAHGGDPFDAHNFEPMHQSCNSGLGVGIKETAPPSRAW